MIRFAYLGALLVSLGGLALIDRRWRLAFWAQPRRAALTIGAGVLAFLAWDLAGLALGIFARGDSPHMTGVLLAPELPLEEAFFLALLCYSALLAWRAFDRRAARSEAMRTEAARTEAARAGRDGSRAEGGPGA